MADQNYQLKIKVLNCELLNRYVTHNSKLAFVATWLTELIARFDLATVNQQRFFIRGLLEQRITNLRQAAISNAYQETLFEKQQVALFENADFEIPAFYSPNKHYDNRTSKYGSYPFRHHYHGQIGEFDSKEEFACACYLDRLADEKKSSVG